MKYPNRIQTLLVAAVLLHPSALPAQTPPAAETARMQVGPGDLIEVKIFNAPEMTQTVRVDDVGNTTLSLIGQVHVAGLTPAQSQDFIAEKYTEMDFFLHPLVSVLIQEYSTQSVSVLGEVAKPGLYPVLGRRTLLDIISAAGGTTPTASNEVTIQRRLDGSILTVKIFKDARASIASDVDIRPGDKIIIPRAGIVYILGNVNRPGGFVMADDGKISILQAVTLAQGLNSTASLNQARLIHKTAAGYVESIVPLKKILDGKQSDRQMEADDILFIPNSAFKSVLYRGLPGIAQSASSAAIYTIN